MSRKPSPGVCGLCGCTIVQEDGHTYYNGRLVRVRCVKHDAYQGWDMFGEWTALRLKRVFDGGYAMTGQMNNCLGPGCYNVAVDGYLFVNGYCLPCREKNNLHSSDLAPKTLTPIMMLLWCPECSSRHIDKHEFATKPHHTHACQTCGHVWRPAIEPTCGVQFLPGFKNADARIYCRFSVPFGEGTQKCACHGVATVVLPLDYRGPLR